MEKWMVHTKRADFEQIGKKYSISPLLARILRNRDIEEEEIRQFLFGSIAECYPARQLKDAQKAAEYLIQTLQEGKKIRIVGDYDIDGVCASYILYQSFRRLHKEIDYVIPDRILDGYGINEQIVEKAYQDGISLILTCDNGIAAFSAIDKASKLGIDVIVTDHHEVPIDEMGNESLIKAYAIVNPKQRECTYPFKGICGAAVAYKLVELVYQLKGLSEEEVLPYMEYTAIATIGDVMDLKGENRIFVQYGLSLLRKTKNLGLQALIKIHQLKQEEISAYHIGFVLGPCLNAGGRLETARLALQLLLSETKEDALARAQELKKLNDLRKQMTGDGLKDALTYIEDNQLQRDKVLMLYLPHCHESLAGIVAGRVREIYEKPIFVLTKAKEGLKGSGRSIESYHMFRALSQCKDLLDKFGGHHMAAGLSVSENNWKILYQKLNKEATLTEDDFIKKIWIDMEMPFDYWEEQKVKELNTLEPFGKANSRPLFAQKNVQVKKVSIFGKKRNVLSLQLLSEWGREIKALLFREEDKFFHELTALYGEEMKNKLLMGEVKELYCKIVYYPVINQYQGKTSVELRIERYEWEKKKIIA
ncbi:single-stranded-DNA-specific exonuclease RecJ [Clostridia bacterium]|nr:single-stranded-DNA-specific exonuclease RecJ [Clostridia bacterium]